MSKRTLRTFLLGLAASLLLASAASAQGARSGRIGLGAMVGDPAGLSLKIRTDSRFAVAFGFGYEGWGYGRYFRATQIHADFLWDFDLKTTRRTEMFLYVGVGPQVNFADEGWYGNRDVDGNFWFGARAPVGLGWDFTSRRLDLFFEIAPGFVFGDTADVDTGGELFFDWDSSFGARYWF